MRGNEGMIIKHEGYIAELGYDEGDELMHGAVVNARGAPHFAERNIEELKAPFPDTIEDHRGRCKETASSPNRSILGRSRSASPLNCIAASPSKPARQDAFRCATRRHAGGRPPSGGPSGMLLHDRPLELRWASIASAIDAQA
jgi:hypothetical protein